MTRYAIPCGTIAFCIMAYWLTTQFDRVPPIFVRGMQPAHFPQIVLLLIAVLSVLVMIVDKPVDHHPVQKGVWGSIGLFGLFAVLAQVDLFLGIGVFAAGLAWTWGERRIWGIGIVAVISPTLIFLLFDLVFKIRFPRGLLTNIWYG